jgi:hypothetical protein
MIGVELAAVAVIVVLAVGYVIRKSLAGAAGEKGSCRACDTNCACAPKTSDRPPE